MKSRRNRPQGRPPRDPAKRRSRTLYVYATPGEAKLIAKRAQRTGVSLSYFLLSVGVRPGAIKMIPPINREAFASLSRIGGLLNQLDRHLNAGIQQPFGGPLPDLFELAGLLLFVRHQLLGLESK